MNITIAFQSHILLFIMLAVLYAVIREKKGVPCMGCSSCALLFGRTFVFGLHIKNVKNFF